MGCTSSNNNHSNSTEFLQFNKQLQINLFYSRSIV